MLSIIAVICIAFAMATLLEHKYQWWITLPVLTGGGLLCWILRPLFRLVLQPLPFGTPAIVNSITFNTIFFVVSLFIFRNSIAQKLAFVLFSAVHMTLFPSFGLFLFRTFKIQTTEAVLLVVCTVLYLVLSFFAWLIMLGVFRFYKEQRFSASWLWIIGCAVYLLLATGGSFDRFFAIPSLWARYLFCFVTYIIVLLSMAAILSAGRFARRKIILAAREEHLQSKSEYCRSMLVNIESLKEMYSNDSGRQLPEDSLFAALFATYSTNPYVSAVIATYAADAEMNGVRFEYSSDRMATRLKTMEICTILTDTLTTALNAAETSGQDDPYIRLSLSCAAGNSLTLEAVYSDRREDPFRPMNKDKFLALMERIFHEGEKPTTKSRLSDTEYLLKQYSGQLDISHSDTETILHIAVNH